MLEAIFFDVDGTLVDDDADWRSAVVATAEHVAARHPAVQREELISAYYGAATEVWRRIRSVQQAPWANMEEPDIVRRVWQAALAGLSAAEAEAVEHAVITYSHFKRAQVSVFDDVLECLEALRNRYRLGAITNGSNVTHLPKIAAAGLGKYFESVTTTDCGAGKPLPAIFNQALVSVDVEPAHSAYVGDSLHWDIDGANNAGMISIWLNRSGVQRSATDPIPRAEIACLRELPPLLGC